MSAELLVLYQRRSLIAKKKHVKFPPKPTPTRALLSRLGIGDQKQRDGSSVECALNGREGLAGPLPTRATVRAAVAVHR